MLKNNAGYVFGLDIGTRNMVGTVGYKTKDGRFIVVAQVSKEHKTRAMLDGQIHDIAKVSQSIKEIKEELEKSVSMPLNEVCIAAAGRVLKTIRKTVDYEFGQETVVNDEHIYSLDMLGVEKAYEQIREETKSDSSQYYCVGYSVVQYYLNDYAISVLNDHKAMKIGVELIATFLPDEVVDGLYAAVEKASLNVANLTLEPIAAINVAIPDKYRLLNIALVDVGAGTSDISIAKGGSIQAFGMMPYAGDEITEVIASKYLVDFETAEKIKKQANKKEIKFKDIMGLKQTITQSELKETIGDTIEFITKQVADKIIELNGDKSVSAVFVVGGGGKIGGFTGKLAGYLGISDDRVALRGQEVMANIEFQDSDIKKDSLLVTPIGICLNFYEQKNNFIPVLINDEHIKLYDNDKVCVVDAALQLGLANDFLFPKRGEELVFTVNGEKRMVRGKQGEAAVIKVNGREANLNTPIEANDRI
ncbi:MAG: pilus assembly protein PilM, partial [Lachnospiraceae bacterium]|nr:pilus assembly protein PilM [Lachnospiraceae bacterium]